VFLSTINTQPSTGLANFSVKEKDEASLSDRFRQDSLNAFILRFAGVWRFFCLEFVRSSAFRRFSDCRLKAELQTSFSPRWSLNRKSVPRFFAEPS
jgi:hypothetical protein